MNRSSLLPIIASFVLFAHDPQGSDYVYFPDLAQKALSGDASAFQQVLKKSRTVSPGEQLEELAEISSKFLLVNPTAFLREQSRYKSCFGADFLGIDYVDDSKSKMDEYDRRYKALESVTDQDLMAVKDRCISTIDVTGDDS